MDQTSRLETESSTSTVPGTCVPSAARDGAEIVTQSLDMNALQLAVTCGLLT